MKAPSKQSWALMSVLLAAFWLLPLISMWISRLSDPNAKWFIALLFLAFPLLTIVLSVIDGARHGFGWWWLLAPFAGFLTTLFVYYNDSALIYGVAYSILGLIGASIGAFIHERAHSTSRPRSS